MKAAKLRKNDYLNKKEEIIEEEPYSVKGLIKVFAIILIIFGIFYGITYFVVKNKAAEINDEEYTVIDSEKITVANILKQKPEEYYVLLTKESLYTTNRINGLESNYVKLYEQAINSYKQNNDEALNVYKANLDDAINQNFIGEETNITSDLKELKFADEALIKIKNKKIKKYYVGHKEVLNALQELK